MKQQSPSDLTLIKQIAKQNETAFNTFYYRHCEKVKGLGFKILGNNDYVNDLVNKTFFKVWTAAKKFKGNSKVTTWLYRIAANEAYMHLRELNTKSFKNTIYIQDLENDLSDDADTLDSHVSLIAPTISDVEKRELAKRLSEAINNMPEMYKDAFILQIVDGHDRHHVEKALNISMSARKSRIMRGRKYLVGCFPEEDKIFNQNEYREAA